jgi:hypothetical protein
MVAGCLQPNGFGATINEEDMKSNLRTEATLVWLIADRSRGGGRGLAEAVLAEGHKLVATAGNPDGELQGSGTPETILDEAQDVLNNALKLAVPHRELAEGPQ